MAPLARRRVHAGLECRVLLQPRDDPVTERRLLPIDRSHAGDCGVLGGIACLVCGDVDDRSVGWAGCGSGSADAQVLDGIVVRCLAVGNGHQQRGDLAECERARSNGQCRVNHGLRGDRHRRIRGALFCGDEAARRTSLRAKLERWVLGVDLSIFSSVSRDFQPPQIQVHKSYGTLRPRQTDRR